MNRPYWMHKPQSVWFWNRLPPEVRYMGPANDWYDGPIWHFGFWFFNVGVQW